MSYFNYEGKDIYYKELGEGEPLLLLHGNTASSKMFEPVLSLYQEKYKIVLIDFLGHGQSDRLEAFPVDLWFDEALQTIALLEKLNYKQVSIIGTSGGALVALNIGFERPDLVSRTIADSFEGEKALPIVSEVLAPMREDSKHDEEAVTFYSFCHGEDWESIVDNDTKALCAHAEKHKNFFHKPLEALNTKVLLTASKEDEFLGEICEEIYKKMEEKLPNAQVHLFNKGGHPAMMTNANEFAEIAMKFLSE